MREAEGWLRDRLQSIDGDLLEEMVAALPESADNVANALAAGAIRLYDAVVIGTGGREDALSLLAADALFTHAFQAQAEIDPSGISDFAGRWGGRGQLRAVGATR